MTDDTGGRAALALGRSTLAPPAERPLRRTARAGMNKTGARILGGFAAAFIAWLWHGWGERWTGVPMGDALLTSLGGAMIVIAEWVLVKEPSGGR